MPVRFNRNEIHTELGKIVLAEELLANLAGQAAVECYGLVGMASVNVRDGLTELLKKENLARGVKIHFKDEKLIIDLFVMVGYGTRIPEVASNVMEKVRYTVETVTGIPVAKVNVKVQGVLVTARI